MKTFLVSKVGGGSKLHIVNDSLSGTLCGRVLDRLEHKFKSVSRKSKAVCINCRVAFKEGKR